MPRFSFSYLNILPDGSASFVDESLCSTRFKIGLLLFPITADEGTSTTTLSSFISLSLFSSSQSSLSSPSTEELAGAGGVGAVNPPPFSSAVAAATFVNAEPHDEMESLGDEVLMSALIAAVRDWS